MLMPEISARGDIILRVSGHKLSPIPRKRNGKHESPEGWRPVGHSTLAPGLGGRDPKVATVTKGCGSS